MAQISRRNVNLNQWKILKNRSYWFTMEQFEEVVKKVDGYFEVLKGNTLCLRYSN